MQKTEHMIYNDHFYVITGGPGAGKTTLLEALQQQGFLVVPEAARAIIQDQVENNGTALPWKDKERYTALMLEQSIKSYTQLLKKGKELPVFFDRGILDSLAYCTITNQIITDPMEHFAQYYRYNTIVFMLPPWKEIYTVDSERKQDWQEAVMTYSILKSTYEKYGYTIIEVPRVSVEARKKIILKNIKT